MLYGLYGLVLVPVHATAGGDKIGTEMVFVKSSFSIVTIHICSRFLLFLYHSLSLSLSLSLSFSPSLSHLRVQIGIGNVPHGSPLLAVDLVGVFFNSVVSYIVMYVLYRRYTAMRIRYRARHFKVRF